MVAIIDYGLGNSGSIVNMLRVIGERAIITSDPEKIEIADQLILPGVGAFDSGMSELEKRDLIPVIQKEAGLGKPILGICLGMQLLGRRSEEGKKEGLSLIPFESVRFHFDDREEEKSLKIPHMGWNCLTLQHDGRLFRGLSQDPYVYFVHSFYLKAKEEQIVKAVTRYGVQIHASVEKDNVFACQFHPEKSSDTGLCILKNFAGI